MTAHPWILWTLLAIAAGLLEMLVPYFTFSFASAAALVAALFSAWVGFEAQIIIFSATLLASVFFARPFLIKKFRSSHKMPSRSHAHLGATGSCTQAIDPVNKTGRVLVGGEDWAAHSVSDIAVGQAIEVIGADGIVLFVKEV